MNNGFGGIGFIYQLSYSVFNILCSHYADKHWRECYWL